MKYTFLILESTFGLILIDQHAVHERIIYEKINEQMTKGNFEIHRYLKPILMTLNDYEYYTYFRKKQIFDKFGIEILFYNKREVLVKSVPFFLRFVNIIEIIKDSLSDLIKNDECYFLNLIFNIFYKKVACHSSIRAGNILTQNEIINLLKSMDKVNFIFCCPHGRSVIKTISISQINKWFNR